MRAYAAMLPRLEAEERLTAIDDVAIGGGRLEPRQMRRAIQQLERARRGGRHARAPRATPMALGGMGIGLVSPPSEEVLSDG